MICLVFFPHIVFGWFSLWRCTPVHPWSSVEPLWLQVHVPPQSGNLPSPLRRCIQGVERWFGLFQHFKDFGMILRTKIAFQNHFDVRRSSTFSDDHLVSVNQLTSKRPTTNPLMCSHVFWGGNNISPWDTELEQFFFSVAKEAMSSDLLVPRTLSDFRFFAGHDISIHFGFLYNLTW